MKDWMKHYSKEAKDLYNRTDWDMCQRCRRKNMDCTNRQCMDECERRTAKRNDQLSLF